MNIVLITIMLLLSSILTVVAEVIPLTLTERQGVTRTAPVTVGIPISMGANITSTDAMGVTGVDAQFLVLSRYNGTPSDGSKPIRSVLVDFQQSVLANSSTTVDFNTTGGSGTVAGAGIASDKSGYVEIDTTGAIFRISKTSGNVIDFASVGGAPIISSPAGSGFVVTYSGVDYSSANVTPTVTIEENGPLKCVIKTTGEFKDSGGNSLKPPTARDGVTPDSPLRWTIRYFFYKNKSYVKTQVSLRNENKGWTTSASIPVHNIHVDRVFIKNSVVLNETKTVIFDGYTDTVTSDTYNLQQVDSSTTATTGYSFAYNIKKSGVNAGAGLKYNFGVGLKDSSKGMFVAERWFWQNHPVGLQATATDITADFLSNTGSSHRILGGSWKTKDYIFYFHGANSDTSEALAEIKNPIVAKASATHYAISNFYTPMIADFNSAATLPGGEPFQSALDSYRDSIKAAFNKSDITSASYADSLISLRDAKSTVIATSPSIVYGNHYGFLYFGGLPSGPIWNYGNQHYDWSYIALSGWLRFDDLGMHDYSEELLRHKADILILHDPDAMTGEDLTYKGGQRYESDALFWVNDDYSSVLFNAPKGAKHSWYMGLATKYLLSGEGLYKDAITQYFDHLARIKNDAIMVDWETRQPTRAIDGLCGAYMLLGVSTYLDDAYYIFTNKYLLREGGPTANDGVSGWISSSYPTNDAVWTNYDVIAIEPIIRLHQTLKDAGRTASAANVSAFLMRWSSWAKNTAFATDANMGTYRNGGTEYYPYTVYLEYLNSTGTWDGSKDGKYLAQYADLFWWASVYDPTVENREAWLNLARRSFFDYHIYRGDGAVWQTKSSTPNLGRGNEGFIAGAMNIKVGEVITKPLYFLRGEMGWTAPSSYTGKHSTGNGRHAAGTMTIK